MENCLQLGIVQLRRRTVKLLLCQRLQCAKYELLLVLGKQTLQKKNTKCIITFISFATIGLLTSCVTL